MIRARLARETGSIPDRIREAITIANNEVHNQASGRLEWHGMACVLTVAVVDGERAVIGHVGDTRLYKLRGGAIQKITRDHSPIGEREDAGELSELDAMRHPRRNEVYRDVGSEPHADGDADFVEIREITFEADAALLLCSDGLTDLVPAATIHRLVSAHAGDAHAVVRALVKEANDAGGKDNITVVDVEGERFGPLRQSRSRPTARAFMYALFWLLLALAGAVAWRASGYPVPDLVASALGVSPDDTIVVRSGGSISAALELAVPGGTVLVEPGEYRERLTLRDHIRVISRVPRAAILRLPGLATDQDAAVMATGVTNAELVGFKIVGDAATPLGTGVMTRAASVRLIDVEISGAARAAIDFGAGADVLLMGRDIHDNPGVGLALRANATQRITHNVFSRNGASEQVASAMLIDPSARPILRRNIFHNVDLSVAATLDETVRAQLKNENWFPDARPAPTPRTPSGRGGGR